MKTRTLALSLACSFTASASFAGDVWIVSGTPGPDVDFDQIATAVSVAGPGDVVLVRSGDYDGFAISSKGLAVVAEEGASVKVSGGTSVVGVDAGDTVVLRGLEMEGGGLGPAPFSSAFPPVQLAFNVGNVWIEDCFVRAMATVPQPFAVDAMSAVATTVVGVRSTFDASFSVSPVLLDDGTTFNSPADGVFAVAGGVFLYESSLVGGSGDGGACSGVGCVTAVPGPSGAGLFSSSGVAFVGGGSILGGEGLNGVPCFGAPCPFSSASGAGAALESTELVTWSASIAAGPGGPGDVVDNGGSTVTDLGTGAPPSLSAPPVVDLGQPLPIELSGAAGSVVVVRASFGTFPRIRPARFGADLLARSKVVGIFFAPAGPDPLEVSIDTSALTIPGAATSVFLQADVATPSGDLVLSSGTAVQILAPPAAVDPGSQTGS